MKCYYFFKINRDFEEKFQVKATALEDNWLPLALKLINFIKKEKFKTFNGLQRLSDVEKLLKTVNIAKHEDKHKNEEVYDHTDLRVVMARNIGLLEQNIDGKVFNHF